MHRRTFTAILGTTLAAPAAVGSARAQPRGLGKTLVIVSSAQVVELRDGRSYPTGFFLNEVSSPVLALMQAGYEPVFANPRGNAATWDPRSAAPIFFGGSAQRMEEAKRFVEGLAGLRQPRTFSSVRAAGIEEYAAVLIPGGHAAMQDLPTDLDLGMLLRAFHMAGKITASICHGPPALLSTLPDPGAFIAAMAAGNVNAAQALVQSSRWIYAGYHMTAFSTSEERAAEARLLGGQVRWYPTEALAQAGGRVVTGPDRSSLTVQDRELITGQQPFSDEEFTTVLMRTLDTRRARR